MNNGLLDLLLVQSFDLDRLIEDYRIFFISLLPFMFVLACLIEYFDRLDSFSLVRRALISVIILSSVTSFYKESIYASIEAANQKLEEQKQSNILLMDMFEGGIFLEKLPDSHKTDFYKDNGLISGSLKFLKYHMFDVFVNDGFTVTVYFISQLCILILKIVYSLVYYLGIGLIGIPCLIYIFPTMGNVLRGAILSFIWCLVVPHILVFILSMIGTEISKGYLNGQIIGGSVTGTALLFIMTLFLAFTPLIAMMLVNGSGMAHAGGIIASIGANYVMNLPRHSLNNSAAVLTGGTLGPKMKLATGTSKFLMAPAAKLSNLKGSKNPKPNNNSNFNSNSSGSGKAVNQGPSSKSQKNVEVNEVQNPVFNSSKHHSKVSQNAQEAKSTTETGRRIIQNSNKSALLKKNGASRNHNNQTRQAANRRIHDSKMKNSTVNQKTIKTKRRKGEKLR